uniref:Cytochrome b-c1 complex subunit 8 n=1 Tax=Noctiluca scintillans TaxID=2966 RepID=A0A7S1AS65_NOCSC
MSLRRAIARASEVALPLRKTTARDSLRIGTYPVPPEQYVWWKNRFQVPGGQIQQSISPFQQKVMFQYFHNGPSRWYYRFSKWTWPIAVPCLITYIIVNKSCEADVEADIRKNAWW